MGAFMYKIRHGLIAMFAIISFSVCCQSCGNEDEDMEVVDRVGFLEVEVISFDEDITVVPVEGAASSAKTITVGENGGEVKLWFPDYPYNECMYFCPDHYTESGYSSDKIDYCESVGMHVASEEHSINGKSGSLLTLEFIPLDELEADGEDHDLACRLTVGHPANKSFGFSIRRKR